ncbi:unnamed protein product [Plutella xylostella]|uniref:(diamondback moth) hypothetical protein n=1 Tax=Plutella xylostella TaxID=51655 RepID=A0A8S4DVU2_PLUXY|nr:unnamed protein product [Plutella xylostella]
MTRHGTAQHGTAWTRRLPQQGHGVTGNNIRKSPTGSASPLHTFWLRNEEEISVSRHLESEPGRAEHIEELASFGRFPRCEAAELEHSGLVTHAEAHSRVLMEVPARMDERCNERSYF